MSTDVSSITCTTTSLAAGRRLGWSISGAKACCASSPRVHSTARRASPHCTGCARSTRAGGLPRDGEHGDRTYVGGDSQLSGRLRRLFSPLVRVRDEAPARADRLRVDRTDSAEAEGGQSRQEDGREEAGAQG